MLARFAKPLTEEGWEMIFRVFGDDRAGGYSYLIASRVTREAAIVNPTEDQLASYLEIIDDRRLRLEYTFETGSSEACRRGASVLRSRLGARRVAPVATPFDRDSHEPGVAAVDVEAKEGRGVALGDIDIEFVSAPDADNCEIAYRMGHYTFVQDSVLIDFHEGPTLPDGEPESLLDHICPHSAIAAVASSAPIRSFRMSRDGLCLERLILEDLHSSLAERRFTPKEERLVRVYLRFLEENQLTHPSAAQLREAMGDIDQTALHVLVHAIRWKQIDLDRVPLALAGQTSKWLRGLRVSPEFTPNEKEFLAAYLCLVERNRCAPSGPDVAEELGGRHSLQWVRKRAHTIRRKQRDFHMPILILTRRCAAPDARGLLAAEPGSRIEPRAMRSDQPDCRASQ